MNYTLTDKKVKTAKAKTKPHKLGDGGGLYLLVSRKGTKLWRYKYRIAGIEGVFAIGEYPEVSLAEARVEHGKCRDLVAHGVRPLEHRKLVELKQLSEAGNTFNAIASEWIKKNSVRWSPYYLRQVEQAMASDVFPQIGALPIKQVTSAHLLKILKAVESRGAESVAMLIRQAHDRQQRVVGSTGH